MKADRQRQYIAPVCGIVSLQSTIMIAESIKIGDGAGDGRNPGAGQLIRGDGTLQPYSTHLWEEAEG